MPIECPECYTWHPVAHYDTTKVRCEACDHVWDPLPSRTPIDQQGGNRQWTRSIET